VDASFSGKIAGAYSTNNKIVTFNPTTDFQPGETVTVTLTSGIQSTLGDTLTHAVTWQFTAAVSSGNADFSSGTNFGTGSDGTLQVALADFDGDDKLDIAVGNFDEQSVVYLNNGDGTAWTAHNFGAVTDEVYALVIADFNGDGHPDIAVGNFLGQSTVYLNNGDGTDWSSSVNFGTGTDKTKAMAVADFNGDGHPDIARGTMFSQNKVYLNNGDGTDWSSSVNFGTGTDNTYGLASGDVNGDGALDIAVGNNGSQNVVYLNSNPVIEITGKNVPISDGDTSPSAGDETDFGSTAVAGGTVDVTFTINNTGIGDLNLTGVPEVSLSGANAADFSVTSQPVSPVNAGGNTTFTIRFDPSAAGVRAATVSIDNNTAGNPFTFAIQGTGTAGGGGGSGNGGSRMGAEFMPANPLGVLAPWLAAAAVLTLLGGIVFILSRRHGSKLGS
jgi:hypothetical protein